MQIELDEKDIEMIATKLVERIRPLLKDRISDEDIILTADEVADYLKLSKITIYKLAKDGVLPGFRVGGSWRFSKANIEKMMT